MKSTKVCCECTAAFLLLASNLCKQLFQTALKRFTRALEACSSYEQALRKPKAAAVVQASFQLVRLAAEGKRPPTLLADAAQRTALGAPPCVLRHLASCMLTRLQSDSLTQPAGTDIPPSHTSTLACAVCSLTVQVKPGFGHMSCKWRVTAARPLSEDPAGSAVLSSAGQRDSVKAEHPLICDDTVHGPALYAPLLFAHGSALTVLWLLRHRAPIHQRGVMPVYLHEAQALPPSASIQLPH